MQPVLLTFFYQSLLFLPAIFPPFFFFFLDLVESLYTNFQFLSATALCSLLRNMQSSNWQRCFRAFSILCISCSASVATQECALRSVALPPVRRSCSTLSFISASYSNRHHASITSRLASCTPRRGMATTTTQTQSSPSCAYAWQQLVCLLVKQAQSQHNVNNDNNDNKKNKANSTVGGFSLPDADDTHTTHDFCCPSSPVYALWRARYHPAFESSESTPQRAHDTHNGLAECFPEEAEELPIFVQALGTLGMALQTHLHARLTSGDKCEARADLAQEESKLLSFVEACRWLSEVQAVLMYVGYCRLRYLIPFSLRSAGETGPALCDAAETEKKELPNTLQQRASAPSNHARTCIASDLVSIDEFFVTADDQKGFRDSSSTQTEHMATTSNHKSQLQLHQPPPPSLRLLSRAEAERLEHKAPPLPTEELLRVVTLVEAARTILEVAQPPSLASSVRAELYTVLLSVVGASEQLTSSALASLTTCLARCVDSYTTRQLLPPVTELHGTLHALEDAAKEQSSATATATVESFANVRRLSALRDHGNLFLFYRPVRADPHVSHEVPMARVSVLEEAEAAQLAQHRAGLNQMLKPTEVLQQLAVLASVTHHRLAGSLRAREKARHAQERLEDNCVSFTQTLPAPAKSTATKQLAQEEQMAEGMLGLLSLKDRKARLSAEVAAGGGNRTHDTSGARSTPQGSAATRRPRRTVAAIQAEARQQNAAAQSTMEAVMTQTVRSEASTQSTQDQTNGAGASQSALFKVPPSAVGDDNLTLTDVAEICSALAAMGYRGSGGAAGTALQEPLWPLVVDVVCAEIDAVADARDTTRRNNSGGAEGNTVTDSPQPDTTLKTASGGGVLGEEAAAAEERELVEVAVEQLLRDVRDIVFALDRVGHIRGYDQVMRALVKRGFLSVPIPAPSAGLRAMKAVSGAPQKGVGEAE